MKEDLQGFGIGSHHNQLTGSAVERLRSLIGTAFEFLVVVGLLNEVQNGH